MMNTTRSAPALDEETGPPKTRLERELAAQAEERSYWSENHRSQPYAGADQDYESYAPAYVYGVVWYHANPDQEFDELDQDLANGWDSARGSSPLDWHKAKPAVREAWYRISDLAARAKSERAELLSMSPTPQTAGDR
jgi:hypothetical protein